MARILLQLHLTLTPRPRQLVCGQIPFHSRPTLDTLIQATWQADLGIRLVRSLARMSSSVVKSDMSLRLLVHFGQIASAVVVARGNDLCAMVAGFNAGSGVGLQLQLAGSGTCEARTTG